MALRNFAVNQLVGMGDPMGSVDFVKQMEKMYGDLSIDGLMVTDGEIEDVAATKRILDRFDARNLAALNWEATEQGVKFLKLDRENERMSPTDFAALVVTNNCKPPEAYLPLSHNEFDQLGFLQKSMATKEATALRQKAAIADVRKFVESGTTGPAFARFQRLQEDTGKSTAAHLREMMVYFRSECLGSHAAVRSDQLALITAIPVASTLGHVGRDWRSRRGVGRGRQ